MWYNYFLIFFLVLLLIIFAIDWIPLFNTWQSRIKIGRFQNKEAWQKKVLAISSKWLTQTPTIKLTDNNRLIIIDILKGNYKRTAIQSWQEAALLLGLNNYVLKTKDAKIKLQIQSYILSKFDASGNWKVTPKEIDSVILAYAILKSDGFDYKKYAPAFQTTLQLIYDLKGADGTVAYKNYNANFRFVDTIGFISPFLVRYGLLFADENALQLGIHQIKAFNNYGMLKDTFIPCHTYEVVSKMPVGLFGWGRGLGWYAIGLIDAWNELPENHPNKPDLTQMVVAFAQMAMHYQNENGSWSWLILNKASQNDSSTTATLAWFLVNAATISLVQKECVVAKEKAITYLKSVTKRNGAVDLSQGDTKGIGVHSQHFDILPFTQGFALRIINYL